MDYDRVGLYLRMNFSCDEWARNEVAARSEVLSFACQQCLIVHFLTHRLSVVRVV
jgi:hypothetical protein